MKSIRVLAFITVAVAALLIMYSCSKNKIAGPGEGVVASINNYELTSEEFADEARSSISYQSKDAILDEVITRNILLQEAQRQNFDKDKAFMNEIENYWGQALLKLLIKKKMEEFSAQMTAKYGKLSKNELDSKVQDALEEWMKDLRSKADVKIYKDNLDKIEVK